MLLLCSGLILDYSYSELLHRYAMFYKEALLITVKEFCFMANMQLHTTIFFLCIYIY